jgi:hypothetical protein
VHAPVESHVGVGSSCVLSAHELDPHVMFSMLGSGSCVQALLLQPSLVQTLLSSQFFGAPVHDPPLHLSLTVQASPSSQLAVLFV